MSNFQGIAPDGMFLLAENRFHDSKSYYEEHKPQIKAQVLDPLRSLAEDLAGTMIAIDPRIVTDPNRNGCVSRVRRDNRYTGTNPSTGKTCGSASCGTKKHMNAPPAFSSISP